MQAYLNDPELKNKCLRIMAEHREADRLVQSNGYYWGEGKGCAVGCMLHTLAPGYESDHYRYEALIGVPKVLAHLEDRIFEGLPKNEAMLWPERFLKAIRPGADLSLVWPKLAVAIMLDTDHGVIKYAGNNTAIENCIRRVASLYHRVIDNDLPAKNEWAAAEVAAEAAARAAVRTEGAAARAAEAAARAAGAAAEVAARAAARAALAAAWAAWAAAWAAGEALAAAWAGEAYWKWCADKLIALINESN